MQRTPLPIPTPNSLVELEAAKSLLARVYADFQTALLACLTGTDYEAADGRAWAVTRSLQSQLEQAYREGQKARKAGR